MPGSFSEDADQPESAISPSWAPPRAPLPPHRLAKLANALGVSTPVPLTHPFSSPPSSHAPSPIPPLSAVSSSFDFRRSPTPSVGSSAHTYTPALHTSKYLLHVLPPSHLPHESDYTHENELLPPPPTASGYHPVFRRGILIPVYPTLQSQLTAIAKEYALPSTVGLVLYLINSSPEAQASMRLGNMPEEDGGPGPRISDDIWRHIWVRVLKAERDELPLSATRPNGLGIGNAAAQSSPSLLQDVMSNPSPLRPLLSPMRTEAPRFGTPSPSTTASHSALSSTSGLDSPDSATSVSDGDDLPLPGLHSPALIPILAKVEFDIDKRKATWYGRWKKTRRAQHAKRAESRLGFRSRAASRAGDESAVEGEGEDDLDRKPALELRLVERLQAESNVPAFMRPKNGRLLGPDADDGYAQLPDSDEEDEESTARYGKGSVSGDPLADVFGTDAETWADIRAESQPFRQKSKDPNVVDLALDGAALSALPDPAEDSEGRQVDDDAQEVADLLQGSSRPRLSVAIPPSPPKASEASRERSASQGSSFSLSRKRIPPALDLTPSLPNAVDTADLGTDGSTLRLAYLTEEPTPSTGSFPERATPSDDEMAQLPRRSPLEEKRDGQFFDEINLGLDGTLEYDEDDPEDRRKSQVLMMATLDEIEKTLAQFSPRRLAIEDLTAETPTGMPSLASLTPSPNWRGSPSGPSAPLSSPKPGPPPEGASWPAVPYSMLNNMGISTPPSEPPNDLPSPPRIAFNGISTELPKSPFQNRMQQGDAMSDETLARKRELEEDGLYPPLVAPALAHVSGSDSPVIPLSPDPFGRFPSDQPSRHEDSTFAANQNSSLRQTHNARSTSNVSEAPSSRFSVDSLASEDGKAVAKQSSIMSVKSIKKLWRRTNNKSSVSGSNSPALPDSGRASPNSAPLPNSGPTPGPKRMSRTLSRSPLPDQPKSAPGASMVVPKRKGSMHHLSWNQESPYPIHPGPRQPSPGVPPMPATTPPLPASAPPVPGGNVRKSILKSFNKSHSGSLSTHSSQSSISAPHSSNEMPADPQRRKGSVVELSQVMKRASGVSSTMTLVDIPRSPPLPEYLAGNQSRSNSRQSQLSYTSTHTKHRPSMSSNDSSSSRAPSRLMASASPPRGGALSIPRTSGDSYESRPSFDESQFEMISPNVTPHQLSYPYNTMDQSMSSSEY